MTRLTAKAIALKVLTTFNLVLKSEPIVGRPRKLRAVWSAEPDQEIQSDYFMPEFHIVSTPVDSKVRVLKPNARIRMAV